MISACNNMDLERNRWIIAKKSGNFLTAKLTHLLTQIQRDGPRLRFIISEKAQSWAVGIIKSPALQPGFGEHCLDHFFNLTYMAVPISPMKRPAIETV